MLETTESIRPSPPRRPAPATPRLATWRRPPALLKIPLAAILIAVMVYLHLFLFAHHVVPIAYAVPLLATIWFRDRRLLWLMAAAFCAITTADFLVYPPPGSVRYTAAVRWADWALVIVDLAAVTIILHLLIGAMGSRERAHRALQEINDDLAARDEEVTSQNQELRRQAEELASQTDEFGKATEQANRRERVLESLLELSRSLTVDMTQQQMMQRICATVGPLVGPSVHAAAILELTGGRLHVRGHWGFGPEGIGRESWPADHSFATIMASRGQTSCVEDLSLRPDLQIPQPREAPPFRSILAAPMRVHGHIVGALETFSRDPYRWSDEEIALVEWLANHASIVLDTVFLFEATDRQTRRLEAILQTAPLGISIASADLRDIRINRAGAAMLGVPPDANLAVSPARDLIRLEDAHGQPVPPDRYPPSRAARDGEQVRDEELHARLPGGQRLTLLASAAPIRDLAGRIDGAVATYVDITSQKTLQDELDRRRRQAEEASIRKTRFLAAVSHDIRTPANAINLVAELIERSAAAANVPPEIPELAREIRSNAVALVNLVSDVLDLTRFDAGRTELIDSDFSAGALLCEVSRRLAPIAKQHHLELHCHEPQPPLWLRADRVKLDRILANLVDNAVKYTPAGGQVRTEARRASDGRAEFLVTDTGIGIPFDQQQRIFDEFHQLRNPERDRNKGTGLGLAICQRIAEAMGARLSVKSTPGQGSTFTLTLPAARCIPAPPDSAPSSLRSLGQTGDGQVADKTQPRPVAAPTLPLSGLRVLLIEDHNTTRRATAELLSHQGALVIEAPNGRTGLAMLQDSRLLPPQALLLDMILPDIDGTEVLRLLHASRPPGLQRVLVLTGDMTDDRIQQVRQLGADALIPKPVDMAALIAALRPAANGTSAAPA